MSATELGPRCFLHIPKAGGTSFRTALELALSSAAVAPQHGEMPDVDDPLVFERMAPESRASLVVDEHDLEVLRSYAVVCGHFRLHTLLKLTAAERIATLLREPRARLVSLYAFTRVSPNWATMWAPLSVEGSAAHHALRPLDEFLSEPRIAEETDNQICRLLVRRAGSQGFFSAEEIPDVAAEAIERLDGIGLVGVLELGSRTWNEMSDFFGVRLTPMSDNETPHGVVLPDHVAPAGRITPTTISLVEQRTAADRIVYEYALHRAGIDHEQVRRITDAAWAAQLVRFGRLDESNRVAPLEQAVDLLEQRAAALDEIRILASEELMRLSGRIHAMKTSKSWRMTAPLRALMERIR